MIHSNCKDDIIGTGHLSCSFIPSKESINWQYEEFKKTIEKTTKAVKELNESSKKLKKKPLVNEGSKFINNPKNNYRR